MLPLTSKLMFRTFIFAVLLLKYCFPTSDQLQRYCTSGIFTVAKPLVTVT